MIQEKTKDKGNFEKIYRKLISVDYFKIWSLFINEAIAFDIFPTRQFGSPIVLNRHIMNEATETLISQSICWLT